MIGSDLTVDASIWVAVVADRDAFHEESQQFLAAALVSRLRAFRVIAGLPCGAKITAVVPAEGVLLALADVRVGVDVRGVLDLILGHGLE